MLGICFHDLLGKTIPPQYEDGPVLLHRLEDDLHVAIARNVFLQHFTYAAVRLIVNAPRPPVDNNPVAVYRRKIDADQEILFRHGEIDSRPLQDSPADVVLYGIIAEQGKMGGTAPRGDSIANGIQKPANPFLGQSIQIGGLRRFQLRHSFRTGQTAETIHDEKYDLRLVGYHQGIDQFGMHWNSPFK